MKRSPFLTAVLTLFCFATTTFGQDAQLKEPSVALAADQSPCTELLRHGIYDHFRSIYTHASASDVQSEVCSAYSRYLSDKQAGNAGATYKLFGGSVSYSRETIEVVGSLMCSSNSNQAFDSSSLTTISDTISETGAAAFRECVALNSAGLHSATLFRESDEGQVTIELTHVANTGGNAQTTINGFSVSPQGSFACEGPLLALIGQKGGLGTQAAGVSCTRKLATEPIISRSGAYVLADAATLTIFTEAGTVNRNFPAIVIDPPPTPLKLPVGTIVPFAGSMAEAEKMKPLGWWPCDGSTVSDQLAREWNGKQTPNMIGRFLRGVPVAMSGSFGGSENHKHQFSGRTTYEVEGAYLPRGPEGADNGVGKNWNHKHDYSGTTTDGSSLPPFYGVVYLIKVK